MGFLKCPNCGYEVSDQAQISMCPKDCHPFNAAEWRRIEAEKKAEAERKRAEAEKKRAEEERKRAEAAGKWAEEERKRAEEKRKRYEEMRKEGKRPCSNCLDELERGLCPRCDRNALEKRKQDEEIRKKGKCPNCFKELERNLCPRCDRDALEEDRKRRCSRCGTYSVYYYGMCENCYDLWSREQDFMRSVKEEERSRWDTF